MHTCSRVLLHFGIANFTLSIRVPLGTTGKGSLRCEPKTNESAEPKSDKKNSCFQ